MKIKATDLRVGNLVNDEDGTPMYIAGIWPTQGGDRFIDSAGNTGKITLLSPIELSSDILIKAGFEVKKLGEIETIEYDISDGIYLTKINENVASVVVLYAQGVEVYRYLYLHQLQNLYFSITGTELNITL